MVLMMEQKDRYRLPSARKVAKEEHEMKGGGPVLCSIQSQVRRVLRRHDAEVGQGSAPRSRGRSSNRKISEKVRSLISIALCETHFDFDPALSVGKLEQRTGIKSRRVMRRFFFNAVCTFFPSYLSICIYQ